MNENVDRFIQKQVHNGVHLILTCQTCPRFLPSDCVKNTKIVSAEFCNDHWRELGVWWHLAKQYGQILCINNLLKSVPLRYED